MKNFTKKPKTNGNKKTGIGQRKSYTVPTLSRVPDKEIDRKYK